MFFNAYECLFHIESKSGCQSFMLLLHSDVCYGLCGLTYLIDLSAESSESKFAQAFYVETRKMT